MSYFDIKDEERLREHLALFRYAQDIKQIHVVHKTLNEIAFYPAHDHRRETPEYKRTHHNLVVEMDLPCLICGVRNSILKDAEKYADEAYNPYGAKQMETHHHVIEWALANAIDVEKFNTIMLPNLRRKHPDKEVYKKDFTQKQISDWVDHSEDNLWVLCDVHHRHKYVGIHSITYPIWGPQDLLKPDFEEYVKEQLFGK